MPDVQNNNLSKIIKRLELIKSLISLEEEDEIEGHVVKLEQLGITTELETIIISLTEKSYSKAAIAIEEFINRNNKISIFMDPEIDGLKLEAKSLEAKLNRLSNEKTDLEKLIHEFLECGTIKKLGEMILSHPNSNKKIFLLLNAPTFFFFIPNNSTTFALPKKFL